MRSFVMGLKLFLSYISQARHLFDRYPRPKFWVYKHKPGLMKTGGSMKLENTRRTAPDVLNSQAA